MTPERRKRTRGYAATGRSRARLDACGLTDVQAGRTGRCRLGAAVSGERRVFARHEPVEERISQSRLTGARDYAGGAEHPIKRVDPGRLVVDPSLELIDGWVDPGHGS